MAEASTGRDKPSSVWKKLRNVIAGVAIVGGGSAAVEATVHPVGTVVQGIEEAASDIKHNIETGGRNIDGKYLTLTDSGNLEITDKPEIVKVKLVPSADLNTENGGNLIAQRKPKIQSGDILVDPTEVTVQYATRIAGGSYNSPSRIGRFLVNGQPAGEWFQLYDPVTQKPVNLQNESLKEGEDPFYFSGNQVDVLETLISDPTPPEALTNQ